MIISIGGRIGSGKSTVSKIVAEKLGFDYYSSGNFMRALAKEKKVDFLKFGEMAITDLSIDKEIDRRQKEIGKTKDNFVIDGRLAYHFVPHSIKFFLDADIKTRAERIFNENRNDEKNSTIKKTVENIQKRETYEKARYKKQYNLNPCDTSQFDFIIDTSSKSPEQIADEIVELVHEKEE